MLSPLTLAKADARSTAILVDEFDPGDLKCTPYNLKSGPARLTDASLKANIENRI